MFTIFFQFLQPERWTVVALISTALILIPDTAAHTMDLVLEFILMPILDQEQELHQNKKIKRFFKLLIFIIKCWMF